MTIKRVAVGTVLILFLVLTGTPAVAGQVRDNWSDGWGSLASLTSGSQNTAVGLTVFNKTTTQQNNTGLGYGAGRSSTGNANTALGTAAMLEAGDGGFNVAVGLHAGRYVSGSGNVLVGADAGIMPGPLTTGSRNVVIGKDAGQGLVDQPDESVAVGYGARAGHSGSVALGAGTSTTASGQVMVGPRTVEITGGAGIVLASPDGSRWLLTVGNNGTLTVAPAP